MSITSLIKKLFKTQDIKEETTCEEFNSHIIINHLVFLRDNAETPDLKNRIQKRIDHICEHMLEKEMDNDYVRDWED